MTVTIHLQDFIIGFGYGIAAVPIYRWWRNLFSLMRDE